MVRSIKNLITAILISVSIFFMWTKILPEYNRIEGLKLIIEEKSISLKSRLEIADKIKKLDEEYRNRYAELQGLSLFLPPEENLPELISTFEAMTSRTGNLMRGLRIFEGSAVQSDKYKALSFEVASEGTYPSIINFLSHIEKNIRLMDIATIDISKLGSDQGGGGGLLNFSVKGSVYFLDKTAFGKGRVPDPGSRVTNNGSSAEE